VRAIIGSQCIGNESLFSFPEGIETRVTDDSLLSNVILIDSSHIVSVESSNGKAAIFTSIDALGSLRFKDFEEIWNKANEVKALLDAEPALALKAMNLAKIVENGLAANMLEYAINSAADMPAELMDMIEEKYGFKMSGMSPTEVMRVIDSALKISCLGWLKHDRINNIISLQSKVDSKHILPWALVLTSYFKCAGNESRIIQQSRQIGVQLVHLKLARPISS